MEALLLAGMLVTFFIQPILTPVAVWGDLPLLPLVRAPFWLFGMLLLPGIYVIRLAKIGGQMGLVVRLTLAIGISFAIIGMLSIAVFSAFNQINPISPILLGMVFAMAAAYWWRNRGKKSEPPALRMSRSHWLLLAGILVTIAIAFLVQLNWQYLYYVDIYQILKSAVAIISGGSVYSAYVFTQYPVGSGYIFAGLSALAGLPVVNTYVLLFPLAAFNIAAFYSLVKVLFGLDDRMASVASIIYGFSGGLGFLAQTLFFNGTAVFQTISSATQDMFFQPFFWFGLEFSYKSLALVMALLSFIPFTLSVRFSGGRKILLLFFSSIFMLFAFFIHMLPALLAPIFIGIVLFKKDKSGYLKSFLILAAITLVAFVLMDAGMDSIFTTIVLHILENLPANAGTALKLSLAVLGLSLAALVLTVLRYKYHRKFTLSLPKVPWLKPLLIVALAVVYVSGLFFWTGQRVSLSESVTFAWNLFVTRYGFLGIIALVGVALSSFRESWVKISLFWALYAIVIGSLWWGERLNAYLFPMAALFAAVGLLVVIKSSSSPTGFFSRGGRLRRSMKIIAPCAILAMLLLSFTSEIYGATWLITDPMPSAYQKTNEIHTFEWIYNNVPPGANFLVDSTYQDYMGIFGIANHGFDLSENIPSLPLEAMFQVYPSLFYNGMINITYIFAQNVTAQSHPPFIDELNKYADIAFSAGGYAILEIPHFISPQLGSDVVTWDPVGISDSPNATIDDSRFLTMALPALWSSNYTIASSLNDMNANVVLTTYSLGAVQALDQTSASTLIFVNSTTAIPSWGTGWTDLGNGMLTGSMDGKKVVLVGAESPEIINNITSASAALYSLVNG
jgi:hypothetical protein